MTYTVIFTTTIHPPGEFYMNLGPDEAADVAVLTQFRAEQPGYISESSEIVDADTRKFTMVFDSKASYDTYANLSYALPEFIRRAQYYHSIGVTSDVQYINTP